MGGWLSKEAGKVSGALKSGVGSIGNAINETASTLSGGNIGGKQGLNPVSIRDNLEAGVAAPFNMMFPGSTNLTQNMVSKGAKGVMNTGTGRAISDTLSGVGITAGVVGAGALAAPSIGTAGGTAATSVPSDATLMSDPVLAGDGGAAWAPLTGGSSFATDAPAVATAGGAGAGTAAGMSTAQKIGLGLMGVNALTGKKQALNSDLMAGASGAQTTSASILDQYNKGQLNAADQYSIAKWAQDAKASKQEYYAKAGLSDSSMAQQDIASIDAQAGAMRDQALNNMLQSGLNAAGIANSATGQAVQLQMQQDQQAQQAQQQFFQMLAFSMA
jgi:hypothetical protein